MESPVGPVLTTVCEGETLLIGEGAASVVVYVLGGDTYVQVMEVARDGGGGRAGLQQPAGLGGATDLS